MGCAEKATRSHMCIYVVLMVSSAMEKQSVVNSIAARRAEGTWERMNVRRRNEEDTMAL